MLDYKLALILKDAGYLQKFKKGDGYYFQWIRALKEPKEPHILGGLKYHIEKYKDYSECGECECDWCLSVLGRAGVKYIIKIPTLSELIEAIKGKEYVKKLELEYVKRYLQKKKTSLE